jgi:uroporphyrin-III C-methyltransferase
MSRVYFVGAGPGDPELLTVKALNVLRRADVVLHDALISGEILALINPGAAVLDVGKRCGAKLLAQEDINSLLVHYGKRSESVVRLKSGDPTIFGRLGEEIDALQTAGIDFEIVPGVTSAFAGAAAAGISLTDRRHASSVVFATAHRGAGADGTEWDRLVTSNSTLLIYMPGRDHGKLAQKLISAGLSDSIPCAIVSRAGRTDETVSRTLIRHLHDFEAQAPSILIVGHCTAPVTALAFDQQHLFVGESLPHQPRTAL